jgi:pectinesterase
VYAQTSVFDKIIAKDGTGDYTSVNTAISLYSNSRKVFFIKNGIYKEKILIDAQKKNIRLIGESAEGVIITWDDYAGKSGSSSSTAESYTVRVEGDGFYAENITFQNTATQAQAVALYARADTIAFKNCRILGYQDTHYADDGRQYYLDCETRGDVDFIFGNAAVMYENGTIVSRSRKPGYVTAPSEAVIISPKTGGGINYHGILIKNSKILAENGLTGNSCYLGRPWGTHAASVFFNCRIGNHIKQEGWSVWSTDPANEGYNNHLTAFFAEYNSMDSLGNPMDTSGRVEWSKQLTAADTNLYAVLNYFKGWNPALKTTALDPPDIVYISGDSLKWSAIEGARGYIVLRNDSAVDFTLVPSGYIGSKTDQKYNIKTVNPFGALSRPSETAVITGTPGIDYLRTYQNSIYIHSGLVYVPENELVEIYDIAGNKIKTIRSCRYFSMEESNPGIYIIKVLLDRSGTVITQKILNHPL